ncbi:hypothetical protein ACJRO7_025709 [Eucalyptus globulus]|uniref:Disease resistance R13L4/SHOC-2-like LRR domain-containing protein n=1 Tax=Eucalyptus globulus TaxID=34317 RepID=A0ABD3K9X0_EUCGL
MGDIKSLLSKLTWLSWSHCPSKLNAINLCLKKLVVLELSQSNMMEDWIGWEPCLVSKNLKVIQITGCPSFKRIPNFLKCLNLKKLVLQHCGALLAVDGSLAKLASLKHLEISSSEYPPSEDCEIFVVPYALGGLKSLSTLKIKGMHVQELHHSLGEMTCLEYLSLECCRMPRPLPKSIGKLKSLLELELGGTEIRGLPHSIGDLKMLRKMSLVETRIDKLPDQMGGLESLHELDLRETSITELPASIGNLKELEILHLTYSEIRELPKTIGMLENLKVLEALGCRNLKGDIPSEIGCLSFFRILNLSLSNIRTLPVTMNQLSHLQTLDLSLCHELEHLL